jgi:predicted RND superfamily exporter protein
MNNSPEIWLPRGDPEVELYRRFKDHFGSDSFLAIVSENGSVGLADHLAEFELKLRSIEGLGEVLSPFRADGQPSKTEKTEHLWSADGERYAFLVTIPKEVELSKVPSLLAQIEALVAQFPALGGFSLVGTEVVTRDLNRGSETSFGGLFPLVALVLAALIWRAFRSIRVASALFACIGFAVIVSLGTMAVAGRTMNLLVVLMPAILVVLTVAASVHLCQAYVDLTRNSSQETKAQREALWSQALRRTAQPCALATLTTSLGFGSLALSQIDPVRDLGLFTAIGAIWSFLSVFILMPIFLSPAPLGFIPEFVPRDKILHYLNGLGKRRSAVLFLGFSFFAALALGIPRLSLESNVMSFFADGHHLPKAYKDFEENFFGLTAFELTFEGPISRVATESALEVLQELCNYAKKEGLASSCLSPWTDATDSESRLGKVQLLKSILVTVPWSQEAPPIPQDLKTYLWRGGSTAITRVTLFAPTGSSNMAYRSVTLLRDEIQRMGLPAEVNLRVEGVAPLLVRGQVLLLRTQIVSFGVALLTITLVVLFAYRSLRLTFLALICNVLPVAGTLGTMGWLDIPLNVGTVTVAGIALGLIVDDTIHIVHGSSIGGKQALLDTLETAGKPIVMTTFAMALGFGLFSFAGFQPTKYFGLLTALTSCFALTADLILLPALLLPRELEREI